MPIDWTVAFTIIISILVPMFAGFGWILHQMSDLKTRVAVIETILSMTNQKVNLKDRTDP